MTVIKQTCKVDRDPIHIFLVYFPRLRHIKSNEAGHFLFDPFKAPHKGNIIQIWKFSINGDAFRVTPIKSTPFTASLTHLFHPFFLNLKLCWTSTRNSSRLAMRSVWALGNGNSVRWALCCLWTESKPRGVREGEAVCLPMWGEWTSPREKGVMPSRR